MKKTFLLAAVLIASLQMYAQKIANCCAPSATEKFATFASEQSFLMMHPTPPPFIFESTHGGHDITFKTTDGQDAHGWEVKAVKETPYYLFVIHEYWGLNDYIKQMSEKLATDLGVNVVALDMYDNRIATTSEDAGKLMQSVKTERAMAIIHGAYTYAGSNAKVFTIGWCFGGGWSLQAAIEGGAQAAGCVIYYGMPEKDVNRLKTLQCDVIGFFGEKDQWINAKVVEDFKANMKAAGKNVTTYEYNAPHAFANPSNPGHDEAASKDSYEKTIAFIKTRMQ